MTDPVPFGTVLVTAVGLAGAATWFVCRQRVEALKERLAHAKDQLDIVNKEIDRLRGEVVRQGEIIRGLPQAPIPPAQVELLTSANTAVNNGLVNLAQTTSAMGVTLTITGGRYKLWVESD